MKNIPSYLFIFSLIVGTFSFDGRADDSKLQGVWLSNCAVDTSDHNKPISHQVKMEFHGNIRTTTDVEFSDPNCKKKARMSFSKATYTIDPIALQIPAGAHAIDITVKEYKIVPDDKSTATLPIGTIFYGIYQIEGNILRLEHDTSKDGRPQEFPIGRMVFHKQK